MKRAFMLLALSFLLYGCATGTARREQSITHYRLGVSYLNEGDSTSALKELMEAEKLNKMDPQIVSALGLAYYKKGEIDLAIKKLKVALDLDPKLAEARNNLGTFYLEKKMWDSAIEEFTIAASALLYTTPEYAYTNMGWAYLQKGDPVQAIQSYKKAIEKNPRYPKSHHDLGFVYFSIGKISDAVIEYKTAIKLFPNYLNAHYDLGLAYIKLDKKSEAMEAFKEAVRLAPDSETGRNAQSYIDLLVK